ncbi:hypothetical protein [Sphaerochaeta sp. PS]|uniref:hypothetical protein n=1 Tax=Sphaerochaeta sp. PS TaxID=3076336 RepID=UPI0028A439BC|nr:hypothetical protein [Sphaerochaeta sp. PS]MDT4761824.1 hypothetical protein [Sphaerochaeta sp. PS]
MDTADLITLDRLRDGYGFTIAPGSRTEAMYERLIPAASLACLHFVGRDLHLRQVTEYQDGNGHDRLMLDEKPVASIVSLSVDALHAFASSLDPSLYRVDGETGIVTLYGMQTPYVKDCIRVVYMAGYEAIPADIEAAVADTIQMMARRVTGVAGGVTSRTMADGGTEQLETVAPTDYAKFLLRAYRRNLVR